MFFRIFRIVADFMDFDRSQFQLPFLHSDIAKQKMLWRCPYALVKLGM
jgi:hypothetical protein